MTAPRTLDEQLVAFAVAIRKHAAKEPLDQADVDAIVYELNVARAQEKMTRAIAEKTAAVLDAFDQDGVRLQRLTPDLWSAETHRGLAQGANVWDALQQAVRGRADEIQADNLMRRFASAL